MSKINMSKFVLPGVAAAMMLTLAAPATSFAYDRDRGDRYGDYCSSRNRDKGTAIGAVAGAVIGNSVASRGNKGAGTVIGAVVGGVVGNSLGKDDRSCGGDRNRRDDRYGYNDRRNDNYDRRRYDDRHDDHYNDHHDRGGW